MEAQRFAIARNYQEILIPIGQASPIERIIGIQIHGDQPIRAHIAQLAQFHAFYACLSGDERDIARLFKIRHHQHRGDRFVGLQIQQIGNVRTARSAAAFGQLVDTTAINTALVGEKEDRVECTCKE